MCSLWLPGTAARNSLWLNGIDLLERWALCLPMTSSIALTQCQTNQPHSRNKLAQISANQNLASGSSKL
eukprot:m.7548 g.7548  ORF g.7548 m.7548 type:complete len:69 (-) comp8863_c0_seq1:580-786(-)